ncbi:MAG: energy transducer TonB [Gemmatimonadaceae bacterium]
MLQAVLASHYIRWVRVLLLYVVVSSALVSTSSAQVQEADVVYASTDLEVPPKIAAPAIASKLLQDSYPDALRRAGVGGIVQIQFVVASSGRVEESSVYVVETPVQALGEAAKRVVARITFKPGMHNGQPVRARVLLPLVYKSVR